MNKLLKKIYICFFLLIFSISTFGQEGLLDKFLSSKPLEFLEGSLDKFFSSNLDKCIEKNINNILDLKIITPKELHGIRLSASQELLSKLEKTSGGVIDYKLLRQKTVGSFFNEDVGWNGLLMGPALDEEKIEFYNLVKNLEESPPGFDMEKYESVMEDYESVLDILRYSLKSNPKKLKESAEKICNQQGIY